MSGSRIRVPRTRGANQVAKHESERKVSADGNRTAIGRYVKCSVGNRRFEIVKAWTLRERGADGKLAIVRTGASESCACEWVGEVQNG